MNKWKVAKDGFAGGWFGCRPGLAGLGHAPELAPALIQTSESTLARGARATAGAVAAGGELSRQAAGRVVAEDHVAGTAAADVVDGRSAAELTLQLLVEAEDGALAATVDIPGAAPARLEGAGHTRVEARHGSRPGGRLRRSGLGALEVDDIAGASTSRMQSGTTGVRNRWMRFNDSI